MPKWCQDRHLEWLEIHQLHLFLQLLVALVWRHESPWEFVVMEAGLVQLASDYQELLEQPDQLIGLPLAVLEKLQGVVEKDLVGEKVPEKHVEKEVPVAVENR